MNSHYTYLLIDALTIAGPLGLSFDKKVAFFSKWKSILPALFFPGLFFIIWDIIFTLKGVWSFNPEFITGVYVGNLPIEEVLFFIVVPYSCLFIYECLVGYKIKNVFEKTERTIILLHVLFLLTVGFLNLSRLYTSVTFLLLSLALIFVYWKKTKGIGLFYLSFLISLLPFLIVNGVLTSLPVVIYNNQENLSIRIGSIPAEDTMYGFLLMLLNTLLFIHFKKKAA
jgi:lycopene cyclase domain-containing protein